MRRGAFQSVAATTNCVELHCVHISYFTHSVIFLSLFFLFSETLILKRNKYMKYIGKVLRRDLEAQNITPHLFTHRAPSERRSVKIVVFCGVVKVPNLGLCRFVGMNAAPEPHVMFFTIFLHLYPPPL